MSNTWNQSGTTWGQNQWGDQADVDVALTGVQSTSSVGTISPADVMGLTGLSTTSSVGTLSIIGYKNIDITGNTSYTDVTHVA